jgi:SSS family solute:Na+ symporter
MIGISYLINTLIGKAIPVWINYTIIAALIFTFTVVGGMRSVAWTDTLMGVVMFIAIIAATIIFPYRAFGGFTEMFSAVAQKMPSMLSLPGGVGKLSFMTFTSMSFAWIGFFIVQPHMTQRYMIAKSHKSIMTVGWGVAGCVFLLAIMGTFVGVGGKLLYPSLPRADQVLLKVVTDFIPPSIGAIIIMGVIAASITTVDSQLMALIALWTRDVYRSLFRARVEITPREEILVGRLAVVGLLLITIWFSLQKLPMMALLVLLSTAGVANLAPAVMGGFFWRRSSAAGAISSASVGVVVLILLELQIFAKKPFLGIHSGVWSLAVATLVFLVVSALTKPATERADKWFNFFDTKFGGSPPAQHLETKQE